MAEELTSYQKEVLTYFEFPKGRERYGKKSKKKENPKPLSKFVGGFRIYGINKDDYWNICNCYLYATKNFGTYQAFLDVYWDGETYEGYGRAGGWGCCLRCAAIASAIQDSGIILKTSTHESSGFLKDYFIAQGILRKYKPLIVVMEG